MRVKEVVYSRLFNIGDYSNERIGFKAEIEDGETPEQVIGQLVERVLAIEESLTLYRDLLRKRADYEGRVEATERDLERAYEKLAGLEAERIKLDEEVDERARCRLISVEDEIKRTLEGIESIKNSLRGYAQKHNEVLRLLKVVREQIVRGEFPESIIEQFKEIDAEEIIREVEDKISKLKQEHNVDVDDEFKFDD